MGGGKTEAAFYAHLELQRRTFGRAIDPGQQVSVAPVGDGRHQYIGPSHGIRQRLAAERRVGQVQFGIEQLAHTRFDRVRQASG